MLKKPRLSYYLPGKRRHGRVVELGNCVFWKSEETTADVGVIKYKSESSLEYMYIHKQFVSLKFCSLKDAVNLYAKSSHL